MTEMLDLTAAAHRMTGVLAGIRDDQLAAPTPCAHATVGALVDHVHGLAQAFTAAARKDLGPMTDQPPEAATGNLADDWRSDAPVRLAALAEAWRDPDAWTGMTRAGGVDLPANIAGLVALDELVVHGWDLATATGQSYTCGSAELAACTAFAESITDEQRDAGGLFGPAVPVPDGAPALARLIALTGRDPAWSPAHV